MVIRASPDPMALLAALGNTNAMMLWRATSCNRLVLS